jgi:wyosine [tRNA(Phe)-imidazoG37] synthetase (radical SAM superfamily)
LKLIVITNASLFHRPRVQQALDNLMAHGGEIWAKLDAGTAEYYQTIERTPIPFSRIIENLQTMARRHPLVLQSLFLRLNGVGPTQGEVDAFCGQIRAIVDQGGRIDRVQIYTVARRPAESNVTPLSYAEVDALADQVRNQTACKVEAYYGVSTEN